MKIKTKLTLGVGLLFLLITLLVFVGAKYINALKNDTENILVANYNTLEYSTDMLLALDQNTETTKSFQLFEQSLLKQQNNISEIGEKEATQQLEEHFKTYKETPQDSVQLQLIRKDISEIMKLNMQAIQRKSNVAKETARTATLWIAVTGSLCFLIAFVLLVNLPSNIANPIKELTASIKQVAAKNYSQRVHFEEHNEFGELANSFNVMAKKLEEYDNSNLSKLLFEKKRIETLINNMNEPVIGLDEKIKILFVNDEAVKMIGLKREELVAISAKDLSVTNDLIRSLIRELVAPDKNDEAKKQTIKIFADGKDSYFEKEIVPITIVPTGEKEKRQIGNVIILKNITPFKELDFAKTNFIATVSHELKTPISSIKMSLQLLENKITGSINPEQQLLIQSIKEDSNKLLKITGELLNLSQLETGNIQLSIQQSNPYKIAEYATEAIRIQADQKNIELIIQAEEHLPDVKADAEKTAWVLINLLTNAIRYSSEHSKIELKLSKDSERVLFAVKDVGKGIDTRYKDKIFDRYFQVPGSNKSGTGLGLAISKEFIQAQGGIIGVDSEIGLGSRFYFYLPI
jgi:NtrC-family two-component system sensor histidine kinase KinB